MLRFIILNTCLCTYCSLVTSRKMSILVSHSTASTQKGSLAMAHLKQTGSWQPLERLGAETMRVEPWHDLKLHLHSNVLVISILLTLKHTWVFTIFLIFIYLKCREMGLERGFVPIGSTTKCLHNWGQTKTRSQELDAELPRGYRDPTT